MVEAQAPESSRKGGFVCRTHASTRVVLAGRMGPGEWERHGAAPNGFLASRTRTVGKSRPQHRAACGWYPLLRSRGEGFPRQPGKPPLTLPWGRRRHLKLAACKTLAIRPGHERPLAAQARRTPGPNDHKSQAFLEKLRLDYQLSIYRDCNARL